MGKSVDASSVNIPDATDDVYSEIKDEFSRNMNDFILFSFYPYIGNTNAWQTQLKPFFDTVRNGNYDVHFRY